MENNNYDKFIADAAREYVKKFREDQKLRTPNYELGNALRKIFDMVDAEQKGINPNEL